MPCRQPVGQNVFLMKCRVHPGICASNGKDSSMQHFPLETSCASHQSTSTHTTHRHIDRPRPDRHQAQPRVPQAHDSCGLDRRCGFQSGKQLWRHKACDAFLLHLRVLTDSSRGRPSTGSKLVHPPCGLWLDSPLSACAPWSYGPYE